MRGTWNALKPFVYFFMSMALMAAVFNRWAPARASRAPDSVSPTFDRAALEALIASSDVKRIEDLIPLLPATFTKDPKHIALAYASRSLQSPSFSHPRVILFDSDRPVDSRLKSYGVYGKRLFLAFNGDRSQDNYQMLETIEYDPGQQAFTLREYEFPEDLSSPRKVISSEINPERCTRCHGQDPQPIWEPYSHWPRFYGSNTIVDYDSAEATGYRAFLDGYQTQPRYKNLTPFRTGYGPNDDQYASRSSKANVELSSIIGKANFGYLARKLREHPRYAEFRHALLGAVLLDCGPIEDFLPPKVLSRILEKTSLEQIKQDTLNANKQLNDSLAADLYQDAGRPVGSPATFRSLDPTEIGKTARLRFIVEGGMGLSMANWTTSLMKGTYHFNDVGKSLENFVGYLNDGDANPQYYPADQKQIFCDHIRAQSQARLSQASNPVAKPKPTPDAAPKLLDRCIQCHASSSLSGPPLPFNDEAQLRARLKDPAFVTRLKFYLSPEAGDRRMPLGMTVENEDDRRALETYFDTLSLP